MKAIEEQTIISILSDRPQSLETLTNALGRRGAANAKRETLHGMLLRMRDEGTIAFDIRSGLWRPAKAALSTPNDAHASSKE
jgi:hypothetical protein